MKWGTIITALFILMMFTGGREFADSTGYSYPSLIQAKTTEGQVYQYIRENPERFINWLYENYLILDKKIWEEHNLPQGVWDRGLFGGVLYLKRLRKNHTEF